LRTLTPFKALVRRLKDLLELEMRVAGTEADLMPPMVDSGARYAHHTFHPLDIVRRFVQENRLLWADPLGGLSMSVTTLLWSVSATLQLIACAGQTKPWACRWP
jgi:hypothetical protein